MRIEEGKQYVTRSGEVVGPMEPTRFGEWRGWDGGRLLFEMDGRHGDESDTENHFVPNEPENDIVAVVVPAPGSAGQNGAHTDGVKWAIMGKDLVVHADGPWTFSIATVHQPKYARLIAAAPQMIEALKVVQTGLEERAEMYGMESEALRLVRAAIAAATGEAV